MSPQYPLSSKKWVSVESNPGKENKTMYQADYNGWSGRTSSAKKSSSIKLSKPKFKGLASNPYIWGYGN